MIRTSLKTRRPPRYSLGLRIIASLLLPCQVFAAGPVVSVSPSPLPRGIAAAPHHVKPAPKIEINRKLPKAGTPAPNLTFSSKPTSAEISASHIFAEPLVFTGKQPEQNQNTALAAALAAFAHRTNDEDTSAIVSFMAQYPDSGWRGSLLLNLGLIYRSAGYFSRALDSWQQAWDLLKNEKSARVKAVADRAFAELVELNARIGRFDKLKDLFGEVNGRSVLGSSHEKISGAQQGLWMMENKPGEAFLCGPLALSTILTTDKSAASPILNVLKAAQSTTKGFSLAQLQSLATQAGMKYQAAKRQPGASVPVPSVVNWKVGHYAALVKEANDRFLVKDPTFARDIWISRAALDAESSGYFLIPSGNLSAGWNSVLETEAATVWGKGNAGVADPSHTTPDDKKAKDCPENTGMAGYNIHLLELSLNISDSPLGYKPVTGPAVNFTVTYNQREASHLSGNFDFSNLGPQWSHRWMSYVTEISSGIPAETPVVIGGGGTMTYKWNSDTSSYDTAIDGSVLAKFTSPSLRYERQFPDGSKDVYSFASSSSYPRKIFLSKHVDPAGNAISLTYDGNLKLQAVSDTLGQVTTFSYELSGQDGDDLLITKVTDPFGRSAKFEYTPTVPRQLIRITDVIGMVSEFTYTDNLITEMRTPYGRTKFAAGESGVYRWLEITDPTGAKERAEFNSDADMNNIPDSEPVAPSGLTLIENAGLKYRNTFFWNKKAMTDAPGDYTKAKIWHWLHGQNGSTSVTSSILESEKEPFESRVWYQYPGQTGASSDANISIQRPSRVARVLDDGATQLYQYEYNPIGLVKTVIEPAVDSNGAPIEGRHFSFDYDPSNQFDLTAIRQTKSGANEVVGQWTYNAQHLPLTYTDAAGQVTIYTYTPSGKIKTQTRSRSGISETTTWNYDPTGNYLIDIQGPGNIHDLSFSPAHVDFDYDGYGRIRTVTNSDDYEVVYDYDALDRPAAITYPDGTYEVTLYNRLDTEWFRDRSNRWTHTFHDALRHPYRIDDAAGQTTLLEWCTCGALGSIRDGEGHLTSFDRDLEFRLTRKTYDDMSSVGYTYEASTSRLKSVLDAKNQRTNYNYFVDDTLESVTYTDAHGALLPQTPKVNFTYDPSYNRIAAVSRDGIGAATYIYNPITSSPTVGAGLLGQIQGPLANISFNYDEYGRVIGRSIDGTANSQTSSYDPTGRMASITNQVGTFNYTYDGGTNRLKYIGYNNGQTMQFEYQRLPDDPRLKTLKNVDPAGATISEFDYGYDPVSNIIAWTQANSGVATPQRYELGYDAIDELKGATLKDTGTNAVLKHYSYDYDRSGNRTKEQVDNSVTQASYDGVNQLVSRSGGGSMLFEGTLSEPGTVTIGGNPASVDSNNHFSGSASVVLGTNSIPIIATDFSHNPTPKHIQLTVSGPASTTLGYDLDGNLVSDGARTYEWDAANRCIAINEGTHRTEMSYDGLSREVKRVEKESGAVISTKQFVWCNLERVEERDGGGSLIKSFYPQGERIGGSIYFYTHDHLGSVRELTDKDGIVRARYDYDLFGRRSVNLITEAPVEADFGYTGHYVRSEYGDLAFAPFRIYSAELGRWLSRDPITGLNLYDYVDNRPVSAIDPLGLQLEVVFFGQESPIIPPELVNEAVRLRPPGTGNTTNLPDGRAVDLPPGRAHGDIETPHTHQPQAPFDPPYQNFFREPNPQPVPSTPQDIQDVIDFLKGYLKEMKNFLFGTPCDPPDNRRYA
jgi:RHS repeat-associated protein